MKKIEIEGSGVDYERYAMNLLFKKFVNDYKNSMYPANVDAFTKDKKKWETKINFEDGIRKTIEWYEKNFSNYESISNEILKPTPWKN